MAVISEHRTRVVIDAPTPIELPVLRQTVTLDREWVPYFQATLTCPLGDGAIAALDPLADGYLWATVYVRRLLGRTDRLADLTRRYQGVTFADLTAAYATTADVTASLYHDYETPGHPIRSQDRTFRAIVRSAPIDWARLEVTVELGGGEARLLEDVNLGPEFIPPGATGRDIINWVLARNNLGALKPSIVSPPILPDDDRMVWKVGQTAWDYLTAFIRSPGAGSLQLELWCTEAGEWWLGYDRPAMDNGTAAPKATRHLYSYGAERSVVNAVERRNRDDGFNAVVLIYRQPDGTTAYDVASTPGVPVRAHVETRDGIPGGHAAAMLAKAGNRGRALELLAVSNYAWTPGDRGVYVNPRSTMTGDVAAVQWKHPEDEMSIRLRAVEVN